MPEKDSPQNVIEGYRKQKQQNLIWLFIAIVILVIIAVVLIFSALNPKFLTSFSATVTPTRTQTFTPTSTFTSTPTATATETPLPPTETPTPTSTPTQSGPSVYVVVENDNLFGIATKFNTDMQTLLALNPTIDPVKMLIQVGDKIIIPGPDTQLPTPTPLPTGIKAGTLLQYTILSGDSLEALASRFNSTVEQILKANPEILNANDIQAGQIIKIPVNIATPIPTATQGTILPTIKPQPSATPSPTTKP